MHAVLRHIMAAAFVTALNQHGLLLLLLFSLCTALEDVHCKTTVLKPYIQTSKLASCSVIGYHTRDKFLSTSNKAVYIGSCKSPIAFLHQCVSHMQDNFGTSHESSGKCKHENLKQILYDHRVGLRYNKTFTKPLSTRKVY